MKIDEWFILVLKSIGVIFILLHTKKIFELIRESFGKIDKAELAGMIFTPVLIWMLVKEHGRQHEWNWFTEFKFGTVAIIVMYGFGLKPIINAILTLRGINPKTIEPEKTDDKD